MSAEPVPQTLHDILTKLEFVGMIGRNKKPNMYSLTLSDANSWYDSFNRMMSGESHRNMLTELGLIVNQAIAAIPEYANTPFIFFLLTRLDAARNGITNLLATYQNRTEVIAQLRVIIKNIEIQLESNRSLLRPEREQK